MALKSDTLVSKSPILYTSGKSYVPIHRPYSQMTDSVQGRTVTRDSLGFGKGSLAFQRIVLWSDVLTGPREKGGEQKSSQFVSIRSNIPPKEWVGMCTTCFKDKQDANKLFLVWLKSPPIIKAGLLYILLR